MAEEIDSALVDKARSGYVSAARQVKEVALKLARTGGAAQAEAKLQNLVAAPELTDSHLKPLVVAPQAFTGQANGKAPDGDGDLNSDLALATLQLALGLVKLSQGKYASADDSFALAEQNARADDDLMLAATANRATILSDAGAEPNYIQLIFKAELDRQRDTDVMPRHALLSLGLLRQASGFPVLARECFKKIISSNLSTGVVDSDRPWDDLSFQALLVLASMDIRERALKSAEKLLETVKERFPDRRDDLECLLANADMQIAKSIWLEAIATLERARDRYPARVAIAYRLGYVASKQKDAAAAQAHFQTALALRPGYPPATIAIVNLQMASPAGAKEPFPNANARKWLGLSILALAVLIFLYAAYPPSFKSPTSGAVGREVTSELVCPVSVKPDEKCPVEPSRTVTSSVEKETAPSRLEPLEASYLAVAGVLGAAGFALILWGKFKKLDFGPVSLEIDVPAPPAVAGAAPGPGPT